MAHRSDYCEDADSLTGEQSRIYSICIEYTYSPRLLSFY